MTEFTILTKRGRERSREVFTGTRVASCSPEDLRRAEACGYEADGEWFIGRDPRRMTQDDLKLMGHQPMSPMDAIRAKCLDCCGGSSDEVRKCVAMTCPSWPFRTGKNPWRGPLSEERLEVMRERGRRLAELKKTLPPNAE